MSLLMEALRKAEEAKRQSAQREKSSEEAQVSAVAAVIPLGTEMSELSAYEAEIEDSQLGIAPVAPAATETLPEYRFELDFPEETPVAATAAQDENLGEQEYSLDYLDEETLEDVAPAVEFSQAQQPEARIPDAVVRQFEDSAAADKPLHQASVRESGLSLTLTEQPPTSRQVFMPELIVDELPTPSKPEIAAPAAPVFIPPPEPAIAAAYVREPLAAVSTVTAPLRAEPADAPGSPRVAPPAERSQAQRRESARAVFNAKVGSPAARRRNLIGVVVLVALFPLVGGVYFLLQELGIFGQSNQYNIPASYDPSVVPVLAVEESADIALDSALPDVMAVGDASGAPLEVATVEVPVEAPNVAPLEPAIEAPVAAPVDEPLEVAVEAPAETSIATPVASPIAATPEIPAVESAALTSPVTEPASEPESPASAVNSADAVVEVADTPTPPQPAAPINIVRSNTPHIDPVVVQAYSAFQARDYVDARALYQQALRATPNSRDAMLGIAALAMLEGESTLARNMYTRLLEQDPRDALARAGLLETVPASDPVRTESELRSLFDLHPEVAPLAFALGNLYASQRRWNEAQQAYYDALRAAKAGAAGPVSPDYAFNLAVSLERLNQPQSAYEFYREALQQSAQVQPNFDPRVLRHRLEDLERSLP
jgi:Tfp pilus assembly protein PilF